jgi:hypothetical protein
VIRRGICFSQNKKKLKKNISLFGEKALPYKTGGCR